MSLSDKLSRIIGNKPEPEKMQEKYAVGIDSLVRGEWETIGSMKVFQVESSHVINSAKLNINKLCSVAGVEIPEPDKILFFDTETTGLAGGTGVFAFLVGLGFVSGSRFLVIQLFMPGFGDEPAMLEMVSKIAKSFTHIASFNGKMFDLPLLSTRFALSRIENTLACKPHLDLLHLSRPVWKRKLESCSLKSLEKHILGIQREGDIDGALIPEVYFNWLRSGNPEKLPDVISHNQLDVSSMYRLLEVVGSLYQDPNSSHYESPLEMLGLARYLDKKGHQELASPLLQKATDTNQIATKDEAWTRLGLLHKKKGDISKAAECFHKVSLNTEHSVTALCELAKHYEHTQKDYNKALELTNKAISVCRNMYILTGTKAPQDELFKRAERLTRKKLKTEKM
jgi:uncharacterized protein YprB with RNaseH-like and TPR domain